MAVTATPALRAENLYRFFRAGDEETLALQGVSFEVAAGETLAVTGPSGSGKSTLLACLAGVDEPDGGTVRVDGERMSHRPEVERAALRARRLGLLFQSSNLFDHLSVRDNVRLAQRLSSGTPVPVDDVLEQLGLRSRSAAFPPQLSGGEAARAGLAVAIANRPAVLLADEPTGELDTATEEQVLALLQEHASTGAAVVLVTHSHAVVSHADRALNLVDGRFS
ncbi:MAG: transporter related protein [Naasia sp.]|jgi:putative ABC transport system ATP-binding protein|uniref:ABC transporter ATP-binding protein n=1 Tax=Naasia sp. TaxID=2546198 RepID=UPI002622B16E|nr:ABC transporter ATP-binding protein [Naasia sp.]MCU1569356.1 transporter related protein [Naasia sp.]